jgi:hypothetical protein
MSRRIVTLAVCGLLIGYIGASAGVAQDQPVDRGHSGAPGPGPPVKRGHAEKCHRLFERYAKAVEQGKDKKANKILKKLNKAGCAG